MRKVTPYTDRLKAYENIKNYGPIWNEPWGVFYKRVPDSPMILFETGELAVMWSLPSVEERREYRELGVSILSTNGANNEDYPPVGSACVIHQPGVEEPIPKAQLNHEGRQLLLVHNETGHAVKLRYQYQSGGDPDRPTYLRQALAYSVRPGASVPVGSDVEAYQPFTRKQGAVIRGLVGEAAAHLYALGILAGENRLVEMRSYAGLPGATFSVPMKIQQKLLGVGPHAVAVEIAAAFDPEGVGGGRTQIRCVRLFCSRCGRWATKQRYSQHAR